MTAALTLQHVTVERGGRVVLNDVSGAVTRGALTAIVGPNAGKSTLPTSWPAGWP